MLPLTTVRVIGPSMEPSLHNGEWWIVRRGTRMKAGDIVVFIHPDRPGLSLVKRAVRRASGGWWVEGDAPQASDDSRAFGPVADHLLVGRLLWRYRPLPLKRVPRHDG